MIVLLAKLVSLISRTLNLGAGVTWAGEIALRLDPHILPKLLPPNTKIILIAGTNGKTTTSKMIKGILEQSANTRVLHNRTGANILNGLVGSLITSPRKDINYVILETDEATLPLVTEQIKPEAIVLLNLFRDQLDRYGEIDTIARKWSSLPTSVNLIINADDPQLAFIGQNFQGKKQYFGLGNSKLFLPKMQHATDSIFCPNCGHKLDFAGSYLSHLGEYSCPKCHFSHPKNDLIERSYQTDKIEGLYNRYNVLAAALVAEFLGYSPNQIQKGLDSFVPAFGRSEEISGTKIMLSKNPAGFNASLRTVIESKRTGPLLLVLNDRIPDGRDVSWIWDVDFEILQKYPDQIVVSGDRMYDLALRLKYAGLPDCKKFEKLADAIQEKPKWILPTYSAMLETRKILTGKKIL